MNLHFFTASFFHLTLLHASRCPDPPSYAAVMQQSTTVSLRPITSSISKLPIRQSTPTQRRSPCSVISKLPMRQSTTCKAALGGGSFSKLPMRQSTPVRWHR